MEFLLDYSQLLILYTLGLCTTLTNVPIGNYYDLSNDSVILFP